MTGSTVEPDPAAETTALVETNSIVEAYPLAPILAILREGEAEQRVLAERRRHDPELDRRCRREHAAELRTAQDVMRRALSAPTAVSRLAASRARVHEGRRHGGRPGQVARRVRRIASRRERCDRRLDALISAARAALRFPLGSPAAVER